MNLRESTHTALSAVNKLVDAGNFDRAAVLRIFEETLDASLNSNQVNDQYPNNPKFGHDTLPVINSSASQERSDILTISGLYFDFLKPECNVFTIEDIAHALSHVCRFAGHTKEFYSVAQHSVLVSYIVSPENRMAALLHDAAEAFLGDVTRPLKILLPEYKILEEKIEKDLFARFGLPAKLSDEVKHADVAVLAAEQRDLMTSHTDEWASTKNVLRYPHKIVPMNPLDARKLFLARFAEINASGFGCIQ